MSMELSVQIETTETQIIFHSKNHLEVSFTLDNPLQDRIKF